MWPAKVADDVKLFGGRSGDGTGDGDGGGGGGGGSGGYSQVQEVVVPGGR